MRFSKRKVGSFVASVLAISMMAGTMAYYSANHSIINEMQTKAGGDILLEKFTPDGDWKPGESATKEAEVKNTGKTNLVVRVKLSETWTLADGMTPKTYTVDTSNRTRFFAATADKASQNNATDGAVANNESVVYKKGVLNTSTDWVYNAADGYFYYKKQLTPTGATSTTGKFLEAIAMSKDTDMGQTNVQNYYTQTDPGTNNPPTGWTAYNKDTAVSATAPVDTGNNPLWVSSVSSTVFGASGYSDAKYDLTIIAETLEANPNAIAATWTTLTGAEKTAVSGGLGLSW